MQWNYMRKECEGLYFKECIIINEYKNYSLNNGLFIQDYRDYVLTKGVFIKEELFIELGVL